MLWFTRWWPKVASGLFATMQEYFVGFVRSAARGQALSTYLKTFPHWHLSLHATHTSPVHTGFSGFTRTASPHQTKDVAWPPTGIKSLPLRLKCWAKKLKKIYVFMYVRCVCDCIANCGVAITSGVHVGSDLWFLFRCSYSSASLVLLVSLRYSTKLYDTLCSNQTVEW